MKIIFFLLLIAVFKVQANVDICEENTNPFFKFGSQISLPNCHKSDVLNDKLCTDCLSRFEKSYDKNLTESNKELLQKTFLEASIREFKKTITNNIVEALKMSALPSTGINFEKSIQACRMKTMEDFSNGCSSPAAIELLKKSKSFNNLSNEITNELASILSPKESFSSDETLLKRNDNACFVRERDVLQLSNLALEEEFSPELIATIQKLDARKFETLEDLFFSDEFATVYPGDFSELLPSIQLHPLLNSHFKDPTSIITFFKSIKTPADITKLRESLYSKKNGEAFDKKLAENCENSFKAFKDSICSPEFIKGNIDLNPAQHYSKLFDKNFRSLEGDFAVDEKALNANLELLNLCPNKNKEEKMSFTAKSDLITSGLDQTFKSQSLREFKTSKYDLEIGATKAQLCDLQDCEGSLICNIKKKYKAMKSSENLDSKLAKSSNNEVNNLLRSMIGDTSKVDPKSKEILIAQGIIPKADGSFVAQPDIPERRAEYFAQAPSVQNVNPAAPARIQQVTEKNKVARSQEVVNSEYANAKSSEETSKDIIPDFKDLMKDSDIDEIQKMQDEIRRRLTNLPKKKPSSKEEAKTIARESFKKLGRNITPEQENLFANRMMENDETASTLGSEFHQATPNTGAQKASVSKTETQLEKWKKGQMNAALADMQGARRIATKDIIDAKADTASKPLTTVALSIAEDPRITLSDVFNDKISRNDSETQVLKVLVRNQKNFILQVKSVNFKVIFDEKKELRILLESGDKKEAERLRPQLEMFLKKLKSNTPLSY